MIGPGRSMRQQVEGMAVAFDPSAAPQPSAVLELAFTGEERGTYQLVLRDGTCRFEPQPVEAPTLRIETGAEVWRAVTEGRQQALDAVLEGRMKVTGDLGLFQRLPSLFRRLSPADLMAPPDQRAPGPVRLPAMAWLFVGLLPWKIFWVAAALLAPSRAVAAAALAAAILLALREATGGATFLERATALAFAAAGVALAAGARLPRDLVAASFLALAAVWAASVVHARYPLTAEYSRWAYTPRLWGTGLFRHPNALLTLVWSALFAALAGLALAAARGWLPHGLATAGAAAICAAGGVFTRRHQRGAPHRRIADLDASLARLRAAARLLLGIIAGGFVLARDPGAASGWWVLPAAALAAAAVLAPWRRAPAAVPRPA